MKLLIFLLFFVGFGEVLFGQQNCVADLSAQKGDLEKVIAQIDVEFEDKGKLKYLPNLFKSCVSNVELETIREIYLSLKFDAPEQQTYKTIIKRILDDHKLLCVDFVNNIRKGGTSKNFVAELDDLLKEYENLKQKNIKKDTYKGTPTEENYNILIQLKPLLGDCIVGEDLKKVQGLNNQIIIEGFNGGKTTEFNANLKDVLNLNSELFKNKTVAITTVQDTSATPKTPIIEEAIEPKKSDSNILMYLFYVLLFVSIAANGYFLYDKFSNKNITKQSNNMKKAPSSNNGVNMLRTQKLEKLEKENKDLKIENRKTGRDLDNAKSKIQILEQVMKEMKQVMKEMKQVKKPETPKIEKLLFFAEADWQGNFIAPNATKTPKLGASIYRFLLNEESDEAIFEFYNMPSTFLSVMNNPGVKLFNVCIADNDFNGNANKIETIKKGKVILKKGKWLVAEKALIRFSI
jgi:hypothetical protein